MTPYLSIDIETSSLSPSTGQILEFGAVYEDWKTPVEQLPSFRRLFKHDIYQGEAYALQMNAAILKEIATSKNHPEIVTPDKFFYQFEEWVLNLGLDPKRITAGGKNFAGFDLQFIKALDSYNHRYNANNGSVSGPNSVISFRHRCIDPAVLYWNPETDATLPDSKTCKERAGIEGEVSHTALEDAKDVIRMVRRFYKVTL